MVERLSEMLNRVLHGGSLVRIAKILRDIIQSKLLVIHTDTHAIYRLCRGVQKRICDVFLHSNQDITPAFVIRDRNTAITNLVNDIQSGLAVRYTNVLDAQRMTAFVDVLYLLHLERRLRKTARVSGTLLFYRPRQR